MIVSASATGRAKPGALQQARRRRADRRRVRGAAPRRRQPRSPLRARPGEARPACRGRTARLRKRPSGFSARCAWISAPGRSLTQCSDRFESTRSKRSSPKGRASSSATRQGRARRRRGRGARQLGLHQRLDPAARSKRLGQKPRARAEIECQRKPPRHVAQPVGEPVRDLAEQEVVLGQNGRPAIAMRPHQPSIEDAHAFRQGHAFGRIGLEWKKIGHGRASSGPVCARPSHAP